MKNFRIAHLLLFFIAACLFCFPSCDKYKNRCQPGAKQACYCSDGTENEQVCSKNGTHWEQCDCTGYSLMNDYATKLSWQDPQKDAYTPDYPGLTQPDAVRYCKELVLGGYDDWRLPDIDELRTLIRGNPATMADGDCPLHEGSSKADMYDSSCGQIADYGGPGEGGCYWKPKLTGPCNRPDIADEGDRPLETVSSTLASDDKFWVGCVLFDRASVSFNHIYSLADVRCIRNGPSPKITCADGSLEACVPGATRKCSFDSAAADASETTKAGVQVCADDGACWGPCDNTTFIPSPPISDVSGECDQLHLTIKVPEKLASPPKYLVAFLYASSDWTFPPNRPPDGGTDYDQITNPVIDLGNPLKLTVPACSYYRDRCIPNGTYYLYVSLLMSEAWPPQPKTGDYTWGSSQTPLTLQTGTQQVLEMEIPLAPYLP